MLDKIEIRRIRNGFIVVSCHEDEIPYEEVVQGDMKTVPGKEKAVRDLFKLLTEILEVPGIKII